MALAFSSWWIVLRVANVGFVPSGMAVSSGWGKMSAGWVVMVVYCCCMNVLDILKLVVVAS